MSSHEVFHALFNALGIAFTAWLTSWAQDRRMRTAKTELKSIDEGQEGRITLLERKVRDLEQGQARRRNGA